jgi:nucleoside-diphosphate-sugar epimerase
MDTLTQKKILVCGAGGFIGSHLVESLKNQGHYVIGVDLNFPKYKLSAADEFYQCDLREQKTVRQLVTAEIDTIYQLAADMGGAGYIFTGENDADIMHNSVLININIVEAMVSAGVKNVFYTSSACIYPAYNQKNPANPLLSEESAYPANPDSEYGWEKLFSERLYLSFARNYGLRVRIVRLHNIFGPYGAWDDNKAKAPAALCRKVALSNGVVEVWGAGNQTRSFLYIDECIEGIHRIQSSQFEFPLNLGSERMISINDLVNLIAQLAGKSITIKNIPGPVGVMGRNSHNKLIKETIGWAPTDQLEYGIQQLYLWISDMIEKGKQ